MADEGVLPPGHLRAFVALEIDPALRAGLAELIGRLRGGLTGVRWVSPDALHITVRFLGWSSPRALDQLRESVRAAAAACPRTAAATGPLGMFPERGSPRVLWIGLALPPCIERLQSACEQAAIEAGFPPEPRSFRPHLTLGRWKDPTRRPSLPSVELGTAAFDHLTLFRSDLRPSGAVYSPLETFPLGDGPFERGDA